MKTLTIQCQLTGLRPLMFDRYAGDNATSLPVAERMYLTEARALVLPSLNVFSLLTAENTKSVCRQFFGKQGKTIALGIASYVVIDQMDIPLRDETGPVVFSGFNRQIYAHKAVARVKGGIPNPKERPTLGLPWFADFSLQYIENKFCSLENLRQALSMGGTLGVGTFRPFFGRYELTRFE